jgi:hypothetical protein
MKPEQLAQLTKAASLTAPTTDEEVSGLQHAS